MNLETRIRVFYGGLFAANVMFLFLVLRWRHFCLCAACLPLSRTDGKKHLLLPVLLRDLQFPVLAESLHNESYCNYYPRFVAEHVEWLPEERAECARGEWYLETAWDNGDKHRIGGTYTAMLRRRILPHLFPTRRKRVHDLDIGEKLDLWLPGHMINGRCYMMNGGWLRALVTPGAPKVAPFYPVETVETLHGIVNERRKNKGFPDCAAFDWAPARVPFVVVWGFIKSIVSWPGFYFGPRLGWRPFIVHIEIERRRFS